MSITVRSDKSLVASSGEATDSAFEKAVLNAYGKMSGDANLAFPQGSLRKKLVFHIDLNHDIAGAPGVVMNSTVKGDREQIMLGIGK